MSSYTTNMVVAKLPPESTISDNENLSSREVVEAYFSNRERCGVESFAFTQIRNRFMFMAYKNQHDCHNVVSREHFIGKNQVKVRLEPTRIVSNNYFLFIEYINNNKKGRVS